jgi:hypothetical protein
LLVPLAYYTSELNKKNMSHWDNVENLLDGTLVHRKARHGKARQVKAMQGKPRQENEKIHTHTPTEKIIP